MSNPFFSVVMPSYLGAFTSAGGRYHSAVNRGPKLQRAIDSVLEQNLEDFELVLVADGCDETMAIAATYSDPRLVAIRVNKQRQWNGKVRNAGILRSRGEYIIYLDSDDKFGRMHLHQVYGGLLANDLPRWAILDEFVWDGASNNWMMRSAQALWKRKVAGTQNIVHRRDLAVYWPEPQYRHPEYGYGRDDRGMVAALQFNAGDPVYIPGAEHYMMHIPNEYDL